MHLIGRIPTPDKETLLCAVLEISKDFEDASILNSNSYKDIYGKYELLAGFGCHKRLQKQAVFKTLGREKNNEWIFLHIAYDLKNDFEKLGSQNPDYLKFDDLSGFVPEHLLQLDRDSNEIKFYSQTADDEIFNRLKTHIAKKPTFNKIDFPKVKARISKEEYIQKILQIKDHIQNGDIYEANFCMEFYANNVEIPTEDAYHTLNHIAAAPFSAFYKKDGKFLISASPERFLAKRENKLISQPIKGTAKRGLDKKSDEQIKEQLKNDPKEQTENVMIVDVARNDLSRLASRDSVKLEELFGVYSFPQLHQLISTISCQLKEGLVFKDILKAAFPMASMTGAPKISAMKIMDNMEENSRNLYSGSVGYISKDGDFDLNVVIRSLIYDSKNKYLSYSVGGAITILSDAEKEYQECMLKAKAIFKE